MPIPNNLNDDVICPDPGCEGCPHGKSHKYMSEYSPCDSDEEGNCPGCILIELNKGDKDG